MHDVDLMAVIEGLIDLLKDLCRHLFVKVLVLNDAVKELAARAKSMQEKISFKQKLQLVRALKVTYSLTR